MNRLPEPTVKRRFSAVPGASLLRKITTGLLLTFSSLPFTQAEETPAPAVDPATSLPAAPSWLPPVTPMPEDNATPASNAAPADSAPAADAPQADTTPVNNSSSLSAPVAPVTDPAAAPAPVIPLVQPVTSNITVAEMGQPNGLTLSGGQLQSGILFTLPADEVVTNAHLSLALIARDTTLELMLNGQPLGNLPLNQSSNGGDVYDLDIPSAMVVSSNNLSFRVHDSNTMTCEKDQSDKYWVTILPTTSIGLEGQQGVVE